MRITPILMIGIAALWVLSSAEIGSVQVEGLAAPIYFEIKSTKFSLVAEHNNTVSLAMRNIREDLYDVTIRLDMPTPLVVLGGNRWWFSSVLKGQTITIVPAIFAPKTSAGTSLAAILEADYKELGQVFFTSETHSLGFAVYGYIKMLVYGLSVEPTLADPGSSLTVSGNILNQGNVPAMFTNVTILPKPPVVVRSDGVSYLGEVDPNSPAPFSLTAVIDPNAKQGDYIVTLLVTYQDDRLNTQSYTTSAKIQIVPATEKPTRTAGSPRVQSGGFKVPEWAYAAVAGAVILALLYVRRRRARAGAESGKTPAKSATLSRLNVNTIKRFSSFSVRTV